MKAIETKFHGPTSTRGSRITASDSDGNRIWLSYNHALDADQNHANAARALCRKMGWGVTGSVLQGGHTKSGMVFCWVDVFKQVTLSD